MRHLWFPTLAVLLAIAGLALGPRLWERIGGSVDGKVADALGLKVECEKSGVMAIAGQRETIYSCQLVEMITNGGQTAARCIAIIDGAVYDVSDQVRALVSLGGDDLGC